MEATEAGLAWIAEVENKQQSSSNPNQTHRSILFHSAKVGPHNVFQKSNVTDIKK